MAEWFAEGFLERLALEGHDPECSLLCELATIHCVPNMNPDGSVRGHLRTNASGANLNREWANTGNYGKIFLVIFMTPSVIRANLWFLSCLFQFL